MFFLVLLLAWRDPLADEIAVRIVEYEESLHRGALLDAIAQLQDHERVFGIRPRLSPGQAMVKE
ncbi:MAG: hypothetical protein SNJ85_05190 [Cyanobacteriota bacterium]